MRHAWLAAGVALGVWFFYWRTALASTGTASASASFVDELGGALTDAVSNLTPFQLAINLPGNIHYVEHIRKVERDFSVPDDLLVRLAWQECRFRHDIITGSKVSSAGAKGMWQLMPIHWPYIDPLDWQAATTYAAAMLVRLKNRFGTWALALAAYNWGEGNLAAKGIAAAPTETKNYYTQILADVGIEVTFA